MKVSDETRRGIARALYRASGHLARIRTYQRMYSLDGPDGGFTPAGRHWQPNGVSMWLLSKPMQLDWDHWDHWALQHGEDCQTEPCAECGGCRCTDRDAAIPA